MSTRTVLIIDSDADSRAIYCALLERAGFRAVAASGAEEGRELLRRGEPVVVVVEPRSLGTRRYAGMSELVRDGERAQIPVLVLSTFPSEEDREEARTAGCARYLEKPCLPRRLLEEVERLAPPTP